ncbi:MAG: hypothetical protein EA401_09835 [Planctomycetota bacterium]|nr:MAG: hypothetical protein EA401_09835 [Planctomycetota bacterium]
MHFTHDQTLVQTSDETLVQRQPQVRWAGEQAVKGTVQIIEQRATMQEWVNWVDRVGGRWATDEQIAEI